MVAGFQQNCCFPAPNVVVLFDFQFLDEFFEWLPPNVYFAILSQNPGWVENCFQFSKIFEKIFKLKFEPQGAMNVGFCR